MSPQEHLTAARTVYEHLALRDPLPATVDLIIGFGHFDPKIPRACCDLYRRFPAAKGIVFTGGIGAGTADIGGPEAGYFLELARAYAPEIPRRVYVVEDQSTNTSENLAFTLRELEEHRPDLLPGRAAQSIALVANACRQRRVCLTCKRMLPPVTLVNAPPPTGFEEEIALYQAKRQDLIPVLIGEMDRILAYPDKGWISREAVPDHILEAWRALRPAG